ncbi:MAG: hypothetical protein DRN66_02720 [Candidatus Nanohalarchaeota archaeon]|nr:MAG: hypothetical protein DRN66_02720 [Candidatus Nanohaloarchaeota archaeon]
MKINYKAKKSQAYLLGGFLLFIVLALFIMSQTYRENISTKDYLPKNIETEFQRSLTAFFIINNSVGYIDCGMNNYSLLAGNFIKSKGYALESYYIVLMPNVSVIFGNYFNESINNVSISINSETISRSVASKTSSIFYFNNSEEDILNFSYNFSINSLTFEKSKKIRNSLFYVYWIKLVKGADIRVEEVER